MSPFFRQTNLGSESRQKKMGRLLAQICQRKLVARGWPKASSADVCWTSQYNNCMCLTGNSSFFGKPLIIVKTSIHFAVVDSQSATGISAIFKDSGYLKIRKLPKIFFPKYWHIASSEVKYHGCLPILCLFTRKEVFTWNFNFVTARIPVQLDKRINLILHFFFFNSP